MVIDSSAVIAIVFHEPERQLFAKLIEADRQRLVSMVTWVECFIVVLGRKGSAGLPTLEEFFATASIDLVPVDRAQALTAQRALRMYGRGFHPAALNLGDSFAYALATSLDEPLLFKGDDFAKTDVKIVAR